MNVMATRRATSKQRRGVTSAVKIVSPTRRKQTKIFHQEESQSSCSCPCAKKIIILKRLVLKLMRVTERHSERFLEIEELKEAQSQDFDYIDYVSPSSESKELAPESGEGDRIKLEEMLWISYVSESEQDENETVMSKDYDYNDNDDDGNEENSAENVVMVPSSLLEKVLASSPSSSSSLCTPQFSGTSITNTSETLKVASVRTISFAEYSNGSKSNSSDNQDNLVGLFEDFEGQADLTIAEEENVEPNICETSKQPNKSRPKRSATNCKTTTAPASSSSLLMCPHCTNGHVFKERSSLRKHIQNFHSGKRTLYACTECNKQFRYREGLTYHQRSVHDGIRYHCGDPDCDLAYSTITRLRKHKRAARHLAPHQVISLSNAGPNATYKRRKNQ